MVDSARQKGSSEIQDGGRLTGSTYISACRRDRNAFSTANPTFSGSSNSMVILRIISDIIGSLKSKMAAGKPDNIETRFQRLPPHFRRSATQWYYCQIISDIRGARKSKMAAT